MPEGQDFKRLVRARMDHTGERYTQARAALVAERGVPDPLVSDRTRSVLGQLADIELAEPSRRYLCRLPEPERRAAAIEGLRHRDWRVRRTSAQLLDKVDLTAESAAALTRALDDEHPMVRRNAVHPLSCEHCKPNGCLIDVRPLFERVVGDRSRLTRPARQANPGGPARSIPIPVLVALAAVVGCIGGIYGLGGGAFLAPVLIGSGRKPSEVAPATLASTLVTSVAGVIAFVILSLHTSGAVAPDFDDGIALRIGGLIGGYTGARLQSRMPDLLIRRLVGVLVIGIGAYFLSSGLG